MLNALQGLLTQAERFARKRGQPVTTAHVLLALYHRPPLGALLAEHGASEAAMLASVAAGFEEHANLLPVAVERAEKLAASLRHGRATELHLLLALLREPRSLAHQHLERAGAQLAALRDALAARLSVPARTGERAKAAPHAAPARERAGGRRLSRRSAMAPAAQQRLAAETEIRRAARRRGESQDTATQAPSAATGPVQPLALGIEPATPQLARGITQATLGEAAAARFALDPEKFPLLAALGRNLCVAACQGQIDKVLGRDAEIERVLDVLSRRRANNPLLVGPSGVGKTAIAHGVALAIANGRARGLESSVVLELGTAALVSGTSVRGALAERLQGLLQEVARAEGRVLVFIDEIHTLISAEEGADTLGGGLKAALARGGLPCIGATTEGEYRRIFERDAALARRFTRVDIDEPSPAAALAILSGIAPEYARHHRVSYAPDALRAAVDLSVRYMSERSLPDKAIALLDQAGARVRRRGGSSVSLQAVAEVVSEQAGVPLERLLLRDGEALLALEEHLAERVVGQDEAVAAIADALRKSAAGFRGPRPLGTFLLLGPTGVGKTEMAKAIAELLFPGSEPTRVDMSELSEAHTVARLLGAPPGYIGHEEGGQLTEPVRRRPYQLLLLDEIEKAHRDVLLALLPLLDEGRLTDGRGRTVDFRNTVIVMTSNLGAVLPPARSRVGFGAEAGAAPFEAEQGKVRALAAARAALPPELWNRIDEPLYFQPLSRAAAGRIAERMVAKVAALVEREHGVRLTLDPSAVSALIAAGGFDPELGARPMRRTVSRLIEAPLARAILRGELTRGASVVARGSGDRIVLARTPDNRVAAE